MADKLSVEQHRRIAELESDLKAVEHIKHLVAELDANRAAPSKVLDRTCEIIARELSQLRQRALTGNIGTVGDIAGAMSVMASRGGGINLKIRGLGEGVTSLIMQIEQALKSASTPQSKTPEPPRK